MVKKVYHRCYLNDLYHQKPLIGIKGRIQTRDIELEDETHKKYVEVIAEKVTFLSSKKADE